MKSQHILRIFSMLLVLALVIQLLPMQVLGDEIRQDTQEKTVETPVSGQEQNLVATEDFSLEDAELLSEDTSKRTQFTKEFTLSGGMTLAVVYPEAVHYEEDGQWKDIDNTLQAVGRGATGTYRNRAGSWYAEFPQQLGKGSVVSITSGGYTVSFSIAGQLQTDRLMAEGSVSRAASEPELTLSEVTQTTAQLIELDYSEMKAAATHPETVPEKLKSRLSYESVFANTDIVYDMTPHQLKESIVLKQYNAQVQGYRYILNTGGLIPVLNADNSIDLIDPETKESVMQMPAPFMIDDAGEISYNVTVTLTKKGDDWILTYRMPMTWLADSQRAWPVILDPVVQAESSASNIKDRSVASAASIAYNDGCLMFGRRNSYGIMRTYLQFVNLPELPGAGVIVHASVSLLAYEGSSTPTLVEAHKVTSDWTSQGISWSAQPAYNDQVEDYAYVSNSGRVSWDVTDMARLWYAGENYGLVLKTPAPVENGTAEDWKKVYSIDYSKYATTLWPYLYITYRNTSGLESYWDYTSLSAGRAGTAYVNNYSGNLTVVRGDIGFGGNRMPVSISHIYNSHDANNNSFGLGYGWRTNYHQTIKVITAEDINAASIDAGYIWEDSDGTRHYFIQQSDGTYKDEDGLRLTLTATGTGDAKFRIFDELGNSSYFDKFGRLTRQENNQSTKSSIIITYQGDTNLITQIQDGAERIYNFTYTDNLLTKIIYTGKKPKTDEISYITFAYANNQLTGIADQDGKISAYTYGTDNNLLSSIKDGNSYSLEFTYSTTLPRQVVGVVEQTEGKAGPIVGGTLSFVYSRNQTKLTDHTGYSEIVQFNDWGNVLSIYNDEGKARVVQYARNSHDETTAINQISQTSQLQDTVINLLTNSSFEQMLTWTGLSGTWWSFAASSEAAYIGSNSLKGTCTSSGSWIAHGPQFTIEPGESLTYSGYVKSAGAEALLSVNGITPAFMEYSTKSSTSTDWTRLEMSVHNNSSIALTVKVCFVIKGIGTAYLDGVQVEKNPTASRFNLVLNSDFTNGGVGWTPSYSQYAFLETTDNAAFSGMSSSVLHLEGLPTSNNYLFQRFNISGNAGDCFVLAGWGKANAVPWKDMNEGADREFGLKVIFHYTDNTSSTVFAPFNSDVSVENWQYTAAPAVAEAAYNAITVQVVYNQNANDAWFDGIQLYQEAFGESYTYDDKGNVIAMVEIQGEETRYEYDSITNNLMKTIRVIPNTDPVETEIEATYTYDTWHNLLTTTTKAGIVYRYAYDALGNRVSISVENGTSTITTTASYSSDGNRLESTTDEQGNVTSYGYHEDTSTLDWIQYPEDTEDTRTNYDYDTMYRLTDSTANIDEQTELSAIYVYNDNDRLSTITTPTATYSFGYNYFGQQTTLKIGTQTIATYSYTVDARRLLASFVYGNSDSVSYTYDDQNRLIQEVFEDGSQITYRYDNTGVLATVIDSETGVYTSYYYDETGRTIRYVESGGNRSAHSVDYTYNDKDLLSEKVEKFGSTSYTTEYTYDTFDRITQVSTGPAGMAYTYDGYGRVVSRQKKNGSSTVMTDTITYIDGSSQIASITSSAAQCTMSFLYTYDDNGNILTVSDGTNTTRYQYDSQNQVIREDNQAAGFTYKWTYDNAGNILSRKKYAYTTGDVGTEQDSVSYAYGNTNWGDLLTGYDGKTITYDEIGNPLSDGTWSYTWKHGRELASMTSGSTTWSYTYDVNGLRTQRTNGSTTYEYTYNGGQLTKMVRNGVTMYFFYDANGQPYAMLYGSLLLFYILNQQGDVIRLVDYRGISYGMYTYDAWGNLTFCSTNEYAQNNPLRYRGYVYDAETGLYYLQSRYYNPEMGRFINADASVSTGQGLLGNNMFAYCLNNPINMLDPNGGASIWYYLMKDHNWGFIHRAVQAHILATSPRPLATEINLGSFGRADILDTQTGELWEIKHRGKHYTNRILEAQDQLDRYLLAKTFNDIGLISGAPFAFVGFFSINCVGITYRISYDTPEPGIILYTVTQSAQYDLNPFKQYNPKFLEKENKNLNLKPQTAPAPGFHSSLQGGGAILLCVVLLAAVAVLASPNAQTW